MTGPLSCTHAEELTKVALLLDLNLVAPPYQSDPVGRSAFLPKHSRCFLILKSTQLSKMKKVCVHTSRRSR